MHLDKFTRLRPKRTPDPNNPDAQLDDWTDPERIPLEGYFEQDSSSEQVDPARVQAITTRTLFVPDPDTDIRRRDRIVQGDETWTVQGIPYAPRNLFTGWRPGLWVRLIEGTG